MHAYLRDSNNAAPDIGGRASWGCCLCCCGGGAVVVVVVVFVVIWQLGDQSTADCGVANCSALRYQDRLGKDDASLAATSALVVAAQALAFQNNFGDLPKSNAFFHQKPSTATTTTTTTSCFLCQADGHQVQVSGARFPPLSTQSLARVRLEANNERVLCLRLPPRRWLLALAA